MDLKLKITQKEGTSMSSLVKQMCALKCRIKVDTHEGDLSIEGMDDNSIENVIDSIDEAFNIVGVDIVPTVEIPEPEEPVVTAESLEIAKIEFSNKEVEDQVNKLMRVIYWAMYSNKAHPRDICQYLMATGTEIAMKYNPREVVDFSIGDIVVCNYGNHLSGEISGGHVHSVVCDIDEDGTFYAAPITKAKLEGDQQKYLPFEANLDVDYTVSRYTGGTILLKKGGYIRPERIQEVVGKARPEFFSKLLAALPDTVRFSHSDYAEKLSEKYGDVDNDDSMLFDDTDEILGAVTSEGISDEGVTETPAEETSGDVVTEAPAEETAGESATEAPAEETSGESVTEAPADETSGESTAETPVEESSGESTEESPTSDSSTEDVNEDKPSNNTKKTSAEDYVAELLASSLASLDKSKPVAEQIDMFLNGIGFQTNEKIIKQSFVAACEVKKVGYESIILELRNVYPKIREEIIKATMREEFKKWLTMYPEAKEKYPKISFMVLLKVFAKKMR